MPELYVVNASSLRLREGPVDGKILTNMPNGKEVEKLGDSGVEDWWKIQTNVGALTYEGYAKATYLRPLEPKPAVKFRIPWFQTIQGSLDRLTEFMGDYAENIDPRVLKELNAILKKYSINRNPRRFTHFMAQLAHESAHFTALEENLRYSGEALWRSWPHRFDSAEHAKTFEYDPERIANRVYSNRMGNGDEASGDGWRYRGRGFIQLTGKTNYTKIGSRLGVNLVETPDLLASDHLIAFRAAADFWDWRDLNKHADKDDLKKVTRIINGGYNGFNHRKDLLQHAKSIWGG